MPTPTYTLINTLETTTTTGSITFNNIPQNYAAIIVEVRGSGAIQYDIRLNGVTVYSLIYLDTTGSSLASGTDSKASMWYNPGPSDVISRNYIIDYSRTNKTKVIITRAYATGGPNSFYVSRWDNTSAVTSITLNNFTGSLASGSVIDIFGVHG